MFMESYMVLLQLGSRSRRQLPGVAQRAPSTCRRRRPIPPPGAQHPAARPVPAGGWSARAAAPLLGAAATLLGAAATLLGAAAQPLSSFGLPPLRLPAPGQRL
jgi:hypothetical protein